MATVAGVMALSGAMAGELDVERLNPAGLAVPDGYVQVVTIEGDARFISLGGKAGFNADGTIPPTLAEQSKRMFERIRIALAAVGATPSDVVDIEVFVVDLAHSDPAPLYDDIRRFFPAGHKPTSMVIGVSALAVPGLLVETKVTAVVPAGKAGSVRGKP